MGGQGLAVRAGTSGACTSAGGEAGSAGVEACDPCTLAPPPPHPPPLLLALATPQLDVKDCADVYASFDKFCEVEVLAGDNQYNAEQHGMQVRDRQAGRGGLVGRERVWARLQAGGRPWLADGRLAWVGCLAQALLPGTLPDTRLPDTPPAAPWPPTRPRRTRARASCLTASRPCCSCSSSALSTTS